MDTKSTKVVKDECFDDFMYRCIIEIWKPVISVVALSDANIKEIGDRLGSFSSLSKENKKAILDLLKVKADTSGERVDRRIEKACMRALEKLEIRLTHEEQFLQKRVTNLEAKIETLSTRKPKEEKKVPSEKPVDSMESDISVDTAY